MKGILEEIKEQPPHIREIFMWVCVVMTFSVIGFSWFRSTTKQFVALVNPEQARQDQMLAQNAPKSSSPFATISKSFDSLKASLAELFNFAGKTNNIQIENDQPRVEPNLLPLSGNR